MSMGGGSGSSSTNSFGESGSITDAFSNAFGNSFGQSQQQSSTAIDATQKGFLQNLWGAASGAASPGAASSAASTALGTTMPGLISDYQALQGMTKPQDIINTQSAALKSGLGDMFREEIMPSIRTAAIGSGGFGGGRQGVAEGVASGQMSNAFTQGLADITANANNLALSATGQRSNLASQIFGLGQQGATAALTPLAQLASILGGPTVLSQATGGSTQGSTSGSTSGTSSKSYQYNDTKTRTGSKNYSFGLFG